MWSDQIVAYLPSHAIRPRDRSRMLERGVLLFICRGTDQSARIFFQFFSCGTFVLCTASSDVKGLQDPGPPCASVSCSNFAHARGSHLHTARRSVCDRDQDGIKQSRPLLETIKRSRSFFGGDQRSRCPLRATLFGLTS